MFAPPFGEFVALLFFLVFQELGHSLALFGRAVNPFLFEFGLRVAFVVPCGEVIPFVVADLLDIEGVANSPNFLQLFLLLHD